MSNKLRGNHYGRPLSLKVERGRLIIEIGTHTLAHAVSYADWACQYDETSGDYVRSFAITDPQAFAEEVVHAMQREKEDGSTPLSDFLDKMTEAAVDDGSLACEYEKRITHGTFDESETWASAPPGPPEEA